MGYILFLQSRLNCRLRHMVKSGDWTECGIARAAGISQPHVHNVLKGAREFSPEISDKIIGRLGISLDDLLEGPGEEGLLELSDPFPGISSVPILEGRLGPGHRFPHQPSGHYRQIPKEDLNGLRRALVVKLAPDADFGETLTNSDWALIDLAPSPDWNHTWLCVVQIGGHGRLVRANRIEALRSAGEDVIVRGVCEALVRVRPHALKPHARARLPAWNVSQGGGGSDA